MSGCAQIAHAALGAVLDVVLGPLSGLAAELQASLLGLPGALLALEVHRRTVNQAAIARARDRIQGHLLELRLFRDDLHVLLRAQCAILRHNAAYLGRALAPFAVLIAPLGLLLFQLEARLGWSALTPGEPVLLSAEVEVLGRLADLPVHLEASDGIRAELPALRVERRREVVWRLAAAQPGAHRLTVAVAGRRADLEVVAGEPAAGPVLPVRYRADQAGVWTTPAPALAGDSPLRSLRLSYPRRGPEWLGLSRASWCFLASTALCALALRRRFGVVL